MRSGVPRRMKIVHHEGAKTPSFRLSPLGDCVFVALWLICPTDPVTTPPFPEYTSGHSVQSGAAASVLTALFGDNYKFTDNTHANRGLPPRTFYSFYQAADEAALSRLYGGIHYMPAIELGLMQGKCIGAKVNDLAWKK